MKPGSKKKKDSKFYDFSWVCQSFQDYLTKNFEFGFYYVFWEIRLFWLAYFIEVLRRVLFNVLPFFKVHEENVFNRSEKLNKLKKIFQSISGQKTLSLEIDVKGLKFKVSSFDVVLCKELFEEVEERFNFFAEMVYDMKNLVVNQIYQKRRYDKSEIESAFDKSIYAIFWKLKPTSRMYVYFQKWVEVGSKREDEKGREQVFFDDLFNNEYEKNEDRVMRSLYNRIDIVDIDVFMVESPDVILMKEEEEKELMRKKKKKRRGKISEEMEAIFSGTVLEYLF